MPTGIYARTKAHKRAISKSLMGHIVSKEVRKKISANQPKHRTKGEGSANWKGDEVGYYGIHKWVQSVLGSPLECWHCDKTGGTSRNYHWANISHKYLRNLSDWARLCVSCHKLFDLGKLELDI